MVENNVRLELDTDQMRELGYRVVDMVIEHLSMLPDKCATGYKSRDDMELLLREPAPATGTSYHGVLDTLSNDVLKHTMYCNHPRHFAWIPGPSNFVSVMADTLANGYNICAGSWMEASGPHQLELVVVDWLRTMCGMPDGAGGVFVSGGSVANLICLAAARRIKLGDKLSGAVAYCSDQLHSSIQRNMRVLGFHTGQLRKVATDDGLRIDINALRSAIHEDQADGLTPFCVLATAGTTNAGVVDPLDKLADLCNELGLWFHVDGAYGAAAALTKRGQAILEGLGRADSIACDPHKWLFQPFEAGCCLVRDVRHLEATFAERPEYLQDALKDLDADGEINFCDRGIQLTRGFRAIKLWTSIKVFGLDNFRGAVDTGMDLAERAAEIIAAKNCFEIVTPPQLAILNFRYRRDGLNLEQTNALNKAIFEANVEKGYSMLTTTRICGQTVLRLCTINPRTSDEDLAGTIDVLEKLGDNL